MDDGLRGAGLCTRPCHGTGKLLSPVGVFSELIARPWFHQAGTVAGPTKTTAMWTKLHAIALIHKWYLAAQTGVLAFWQ
jgi:hypothetical protein